jgi:hypothetical protein
MQRSVSDLMEILLNGINDAWRDDAAEALGSVPAREEATAALVAAIGSPTLDDSLRCTCAESLAQIWIHEGKAQPHILAKLSGMPRNVVESYLRAAQIPF